MTKNKLRSIFLIPLLFILTACSLAPCYRPPLVATPLHYKESSQWVRAKPLLSERKPWWEMYGDPELNALETKLTQANQNLKTAFARYQEARAATEIAQSLAYPTVRGVANASRQQFSGNVGNKSSNPLYSDMLVGGVLTYEIDVWGRVHNTIVASKNRLQASAADLAAVDLSLHAELASDYFSLRGADASTHVLDNIVIAYQKALGIVKKRHLGGIASQADEDEAATQLESAKTLAADIRLRRAQFEHAIAVLIGEPPAYFAIKPPNAKVKFVAVAPYLPSTLLQRRPDVAAALKRVEAANADIGVARAAFFPAFNLSMNGGLESATFRHLFAMPSLFWSLGAGGAAGLIAPAASLTLIDGGKIQGQLDQATATYYETVATYRQTVLTAYQEVEDNLAAIRQLGQEYHTQTQAAYFANRSLIQAHRRYYGGIITYLDVVIIQNTALQTQLAAIDIETKRQIASVQLIKSLGGGFHEG